MTRLILFLSLLSALNLQAQEDFDAMRGEMVSEVEAMVTETRSYTDTDSLDPRVIEAIRKVPRHEFVPAPYLEYAYENRPLPIGADQTISQPYIVALMTDLAKLNSESVVLEIGTGSGYQAAVLGELVRHVYSIEIIESLALRAGRTLSRLGYDNVSVRIGDGYNGWPDHALFDAILVTAAADKIPQPLIDQLTPGGTLVMPVGPQTSSQILRVLQKQNDGSIIERDVLPVGFVPLTRAE